VPGVPTFAVDNGFWYSIPEQLEDSIQVGSIVRVPLSGRKTRGFVVELSGERQGKLKDIAALSSEVPVFGPDLLKTLRWAASHYVAPLPVVLERASPPNLPATSGGRPPDPRSLAPEIGAVEVVPFGGEDHPLVEIALAAAGGRRGPPTAIIGRWQALDWLGSLAPVLVKGMSVLTVTATETEATTIAEAAGALGIPVVVVAGEGGRELTEAWSEAQGGGRLVVGTPRVATWQIAGLALGVVLEEGRRAMKDRQTPTIHVRDVMATRSRIEGFSLVFFGPTPSIEVLASGPEVIRVGTRAWPLVEIVDRREDAPGSGLLAERSVAAMRAMVSEGRRSFVFTHRRSSDSSMRCVDCRRVRTCAGCGSRIGRDPTCRRCGRPTGPCANCGATGFEEMGSQPERLGTEINRRLGSEVAAPHPTDRPVAVGTERDLASLKPVPLVVAADVDGLMLGHNYRTSEEALRILARLANAVEPGHGRRMIAQTSLPDAPLITALRRGDPVPFLEGLLVERARLGLPPASEMLAIEVRGKDDPAGFDEDIRALEPPTVLGPARVAQGWRWLLQGPLGPLKLALRPLIQRWRESGATVRVDVDPIDL
jgi:primosomal protein N' (replication factor Y)